MATQKIDETPSISTMVKQHGLNFLFAFFERGEPVVRVKNFQTGAVTEHGVENKYVFIGEHRRKEHGPRIFEDGIKSGIPLHLVLKSIIDDESEVSPMVGGPVDILNFTEAGGRWRERKPECAERE